ncbi:tRNA (guanosine(37)-N1)-methyltransferase TrmD [bacterium]|nr:tRNA (guanosine(37)-N1)-methyltransferase TrmD [bacterium]
MEISILTIFPAFVETVFKFGVVRRAVDSGIVSGKSVDIRSFAGDPHASVDDVPFGGGPGMVMMPEPVWLAAESLADEEGGKPFLVYTSPHGREFTQVTADELAVLPRLAILCGRYEGVDQRIIDHLVDMEVSLGDFVMSGGELAAMVITDAVVRRIPGVLGNEDSHNNESFVDGLLEHPQYTRPENFKGMRVPGVLLKGDHDAVARHRRMEAMRVTKEKRPDLWKRFCDRYGEHEEN